MEEGGEDGAEQSSDEEEDSEYERLMRDLSQPPVSLRRNVPLNDYQAKMKKVFAQDEKYDIKDIVKDNGGGGGVPTAAN